MFSPRISRIIGATRQCKLVPERYLTALNLCQSMIRLTSTGLKVVMSRSKCRSDVLYPALDRAASRFVYKISLSASISKECGGNLDGTLEHPTIC